MLFVNCKTHFIHELHVNATFGAKNVLPKLIPILEFQNIRECYF